MWVWLSFDARFIQCQYCSNISALNSAISCCWCATGHNTGQTCSMPMWSRPVVMHSFQTLYPNTSWSSLHGWLHLDLGIETCFVSHLDMFWKVLLQFASPLYIWLLVVAMSRYSTVEARLSGSNSVPVLATLFLLSYMPKVLPQLLLPSPSHL